MVLCINRISIYTWQFISYNCDKFFNNCVPFIQSFFLANVDHLWLYFVNLALH